MTPLLVLGLALLGAQERTYLNIGDVAPPLRPAKWLKGAPVERYGRVTVVEFWATWCGPCKENIPHLTELAKKYAGKADIVGVDIWESNDPQATNTIPKVAAFVKSQGARMDYHVAVDARDNRVANAWMKKADEGGLPTSFIVGKDGKIAWIGHPAKLEEALIQVVDGTFDVSAARSRRALEVETTRPVHEAIEGKRWKDVLRLTDLAVAKRPELGRIYAYDRLTATFHTDLEAGKTQAEAALKETNEDIGTYQMVASIFASQKDLSPAAYGYGKAIVDRALVKKDREYLFLAMGAEIRSSLKDPLGAVEFQDRAVRAAEVDTHAPPDFVTFLRRNLERFREAAKKGS